MTDWKLEITVPQLGEGLREVLVLEVYKRSGDRVHQGDVLCQVETEKAVTEIEAPANGVLRDWSAAEGDTLAVGTIIGWLELSAPAPSSTTSDPADDQAKIETGRRPSVTSATNPASARNQQMPPRTRKMLQQHGLEDDVEQIPRHGPKLVPADILTYLKTRSTTGGDGAGPQNPSVQFTAAQRIESHRLAQGASQCVPATVTVRVEWKSIESAIAASKLQGHQANRLATITFAWCIGQAVLKHPVLRSRLTADNQRSLCDEAKLGIAVQSDDAEFSVATVPISDGQSWQEFHDAASASVEAAEQGNNQANQDINVMLSNMMPYRVHDAVPTVVAPAAATVFVGDVFAALDERDLQAPPRRVFNVCMTFDHRIVSGIAAARFVQAVRGSMEQFAPPDQRSERPRTVSDDIVEKFAELLEIAPSLIQHDLSLAGAADDSLSLVDVEIATEKLARFVQQTYGHTISPEALISMRVRDIVHQVRQIRVSENRHRQRDLSAGLIEQEQTETTE